MANLAMILAILVATTHSTDSTDSAEVTSMPRIDIGRISQLRLHNDTSRGYAFEVQSADWCGNDCGRGMPGLNLVDIVDTPMELPFHARSVPIIAVSMPPDGDEKSALFWDNIQQITNTLGGCGADAVLIFHGSGHCHDPHTLVQLFGKCYSAGSRGIESLKSDSRQHGCLNITAKPTPAIFLDTGVADIVAAARYQIRHQDTLRNITVDLNVKHAACTDNTYFPLMYWALVPVWTAITVIWIALSFQIHSNFATTIHSVMTVVPVLKLMDVVISAWLWMDCVDTGSFSIPAVLAWVAVRSLYQPFFMLMFLLLAHGWCILCRDMSRIASLRISLVVTALYLCLALNFVYAGSYWWLVATVTLSAIMYSMVKIQKFIQDLRERMASMQPEINFQGIYAQVKHKHTMFSRLQKFVFVYFVLLFIDYAAVQQIWQQQQAWKAQMFDQSVQVFIVVSLGCLFRPKQAGTGDPGARFFLDSTDISSSGVRRPVPFYEMAEINGSQLVNAETVQIGEQGEMPAVVILNPGHGSHQAGARLRTGAPATDEASASFGVAVGAGEAF
jgi:hypothetical protein